MCGKTARLQVHHIYPVAFIRAAGRPELELDSRNFAGPFCAVEGFNHHCVVAHGGSFKTFLRNWKESVRLCKGKTMMQIYACPKWNALPRQKLLADMSAAEIRELRAELDRVFP